jgi:hypothetical protein
MSVGKMQKKIILTLLASIRKFSLRLDSKRPCLRYRWVEAPDGSFDHWFDVDGRVVSVWTVSDRLGFWRLVTQLLAKAELVLAETRREHKEQIAAASERYYCLPTVFNLREEAYRPLGQKGIKR